MHSWITSAVIDTWDFILWAESWLSFNCMEKNTYIFSILTKDQVFSESNFPVFKLPKLPVPQSRSPHLNGNPDTFLGHNYAYYYARIMHQI